MQFHKRRQYLINKAMQWAAVGYVFVIVLLILGFQTWLTYTRLNGNATIEPEKLPHLLVQDVFITLAVMSVFVVFMGIFGSHKVAGPLYRCEKTLKAMQGGDLTDIIRLRRGDLLVPFTEEMNLALANLREFAAEDRAHVQEAVRLIQLARGGIKMLEVQTSLDRAMSALTKVGAKLKIENEIVRARFEGNYPGYDANKTMPIATLPRMPQPGPHADPARTPPPVVVAPGNHRAPPLPAPLYVPPPLPPPPPPAPSLLHAAPAAHREGDATVALHRVQLAPPPPQPQPPPGMVGSDSGATMPIRRSDLDLTPPPAPQPGMDSSATMPLRRSDLNLTPPPGKS